MLSPHVVASATWDEKHHLGRCVVQALYRSFPSIRGETHRSAGCVLCVDID